jgi:hypothetical protein
MWRPSKTRGSGSDLSELRIPTTERGLEIAIEDPGSRLKEQVCSTQLVELTPNIGSARRTLLHLNKSLFSRLTDGLNTERRKLC